MSKKNKHNQTVGSTVERSDDRIAETGEVFTPMELCARMVSEIPEHILKDPTSTFLDNSAGSGNFLLALYSELQKYHSSNHILNNMLYAIELMEDNHKELCERLGVPVTHPHYVCGSGLDPNNYKFGELNTLEILLYSNSGASTLPH